MTQNSNPANTPKPATPGAEAPKAEANKSADHAAKLTGDADKAPTKPEDAKR